jgi:hypothetical protein
MNNKHRDQHFNVVGPSTTLLFGVAPCPWPLGVTPSAALTARGEILPLACAIWWIALMRFFTTIGGIVAATPEKFT